MPTLYNILMSPWSFKARWAMAYHDTPYTSVEVIPLVTDWVIRFKTGRWGKVTYPVMFKDDGSALTESFDIAKWSSENQGPDSEGDLFRGVDLDELKDWAMKSHETLAYGRTVAFNKMIVDDEAVMVALPKFMRFLGPLAVIIGKWALTKMRKKYINEPGAMDRDKAQANLVALREALKGGKEYILGKFSYADVVMVVSLHLVKPCDQIPAGKAIKRLLAHPSLEDEFPDLIEWRDGILEKHFKVGKKRV